MALLIALARVLFAAGANVYQKKLTHLGLHSLSVVMLSYLMLAVISLPLVPFTQPTELSGHFWLNITLAALLDMAGTLFLVLSLSKTDLSVFGPLNAYKVVISMLLAMVFLGEIPSLTGFVGVAVIVIGSVFLFPSNQRFSFARVAELFRQRGVQYRFLSIVLFSVGTLPLKTAVVSGGALATTVYWCLLGMPLAVAMQAVFRPQVMQQDWLQARPHWPWFIYLGALMFLMQLMTMLVLSELFIAYSLALFQLSMVLQVFLGHRIFNEPHFWQRLSACGVMVAGSLIIIYA